MIDFLNHIPSRTGSTGLHEKSLELNPDPGAMKADQGKMQVQYRRQGVNGKKTRLSHGQKLDHGALGPVTVNLRLEPRLG